MPRVPVGAAEEDVEVRVGEEEEDCVEDTEPDVDVEVRGREDEDTEADKDVEDIVVVPEEEDFVDETNVDEADPEVLELLEVVVTLEPPSLYISILLPAPQYSY